MGVVEDVAAGFTDGTSTMVVHVGRGVQSDPGVPVFVCVPTEEVVAEHPGVLDAAEGLGEVRPVLQGLVRYAGESGEKLNVNQCLGDPVVACCAGGRCTGSAGANGAWANSLRSNLRPSTPRPQKRPETSTRESTKAGSVPFDKEKKMSEGKRNG